MDRAAAPTHAFHAAFALQEVTRKLIVLGSAMVLILAGKPLPF